MSARVFAPAVVVAALVVGALSGTSTAAAGGEPVHARYHADGSWDVVVDVVTYPSGQTGVIYRPLPVGDERFPILVWGNGSDATPEVHYPKLLRSVASHGFVITATDHQQVGTGEPLLESLDFVQSLAGDPDSDLHGHVATDSVGIFGHSQGAGGSTKAASVSDEIDAVALLALPARVFAFEAEKKFDTANVSAPTLLLAGTLDIPISPTPVNQDHYARLTGPAAMAMITGAEHLEFTSDGGISRGYIVAWFAYLLRGDVDAASAFVGADPELFRHPAFESQAAKALPAARSPVTDAVTDLGGAQVDPPGSDAAGPDGGNGDAGAAGLGSLPETGREVFPAWIVVVAGAALFGLGRRTRRHT